MYKFQVRVKKFYYCATNGPRYGFGRSVATAVVDLERGGLPFEEVGHTIWSAAEPLLFEATSQQVKLARTRETLLTPIGFSEVSK